MTIRRMLLALCFAGTLAAQTFIQMPDPQFGMYTKKRAPPGSARLVLLVPAPLGVAIAALKLRRRTG